MLSLDPVKLSQEMNRAEEFRRKHLILTQDIVRRFMGNYYRWDYSGSPTPENDVFSYVAFMLPELAFALPSCRVQASRVQSDAQMAEDMETGLRSWCLQHKSFVDELQDVVRDAIFGYGVMMTGVEPRDTATDHGNINPGPIAPFGCRISPDCLILDPLCEKPQDARFIGHTYWRDLNELQDPEMWDQSQVSQLASQWNEYETDNVSERYLRKPITGQRDRVNLCDIWIPEANTLLTLSRQGTTGGGILPMILRQTKWWGPPEGPYEIFGFYRVPGDPYPLGPLQPIMEELEQKWAHQNAAANEAECYKKFAVIEAANVEMQNAIQNAKSGDSYTARGLGDYKIIELGGSPAGRMEYIQQLRDQTDRTVGISDAQRGRVQGKTATENEIVESNVDARTSYLRTRINNHVERVLNRVAWYLFNDPAVVMDVQVTNPMTGQKSQGSFLGGPQPGQEDADWSRFHLSIEPTSLQRTDDAMVQSRAETLINLAPNIAQGMMQLPWVNWRYIVNMFGESFNQKELSSLLFNQQMLAQFQQTAAAFGMVDPSVQLPGAPMGGPGMPPPPGMPGAMPMGGMPSGPLGMGPPMAGAPGPGMLRGGGAPPGGMPSSQLTGSGGGALMQPSLPPLAGQGRPTPRGGSGKPFMFLGQNPNPRQKMKQQRGAPTPAPASIPPGRRGQARPQKKPILPS